MKKAELSHQLHPLCDAPLRTACVVAGVTAPGNAPEWARWLAEIGFIAGEQVSVLARGMPGNDPLVVRAGSSTFALRRAEAGCVQVRLLVEVEVAVEATAT
jgi:ferrous iron transport protein A